MPHALSANTMNPQSCNACRNKYGIFLCSPLKSCSDVSPLSRAHYADLHARPMAPCSAASRLPDASVPDRFPVAAFNDAGTVALPGVLRRRREGGADVRSGW